MPRRWDDSYLPGAVVALLIVSAAVYPWIHWWPQADHEGFDRFLMHMVRLIWPTCGAILAAGLLADAMVRIHLNGRPNPRNERLANLCRAIGLLLGSGVHFSQYMLNQWVIAGWVAAGLIGFGLGYAVSARRPADESRP